ncbi:hypothetical protein NEIMUCOT_04201 [Neisseria mucosa ATCC 25996]|uniref:Uncharacterized protein n=1 Tax=Neisseria mucosa (strain ATCC 25996 / DSM 4631 / NCTC 10774 / M26) TaxID=546266 RepID=D2ZUB3_NEIM2|nr:hypothetical protein NEIMUCOT_04201 [Neisseria mucosa ATCC 25996]
MTGYGRLIRIPRHCAYQFGHANFDADCHFRRPATPHYRI